MNSGIVELVLFGVISGWLLYLSRKSLRVPGSHGFYRFFAWESILALILINCRAWFFDPMAVRQIISWLLLCASLIMVGQGFTKLRRAGQPGITRQDGSLLDFEKTSTLVTSGIYRHIRHPLYGSLLLLAWGAFLKDVSWASACLVLVATLTLVATAKADEAECVRYFGPSYEEYMRRTKMFIPLLF